jgi:hypothetical protein
MQEVQTIASVFDIYEPKVTSVSIITPVSRACLPRQASR